jgi:hypothetical protein
MEAIRRIPRVRVIIKRPNWEQESSLEEFLIVTFEDRPCALEEKSEAKGTWEQTQNYDAHSDALLSYSYTESRQNVDSPFTLSLTPETDKDGLTWVDKIAMFDLVYIEEFGAIRYCGIVHRVRYSARMGDAPERSIMVEGNGFGELLKTFQLILDTKLFINTSAELEDLRAKSEFITKADSTLEVAIMYYYANFKKIVGEKKEGSQPVQSVLIALIEAKVRLQVDDNCHTLLPICQSMYQSGANTLWDIIRKIVPDPMYELFGHWDSEQQKYVITARQCPFREKDWKKLPVYTINPITLKDYNLEYDDTEISTVFYAIAPSLGYTNNMVLVVDELNRNLIVDDKKWKKYGYRPLFVELSFLKRDDVHENDIEKSLNTIGKLLRDWYGHNDELVTGALSVISYEDKDYTYPVIGGRLAFLGGEFYIDEIQRRWSYGTSPTSELKVTRGGIYQEGAYSGRIQGLGRRLNELEAIRKQWEDG